MGAEMVAVKEKRELSRLSESLFSGSGEEELEAAARMHPAVFLDCYGRLFDPTVQEEKPFHLWDWQWEFLTHLMRNKRVVVLKARQLGVSWLVAGYGLWRALYQPNTSVLMVSRTEGVAADLLSKSAFIYRRLPEALKPPGDPRKDKDNATELYWSRTNAKVTALASTKEAGRSESASLVIADEWADHPFAAEMFTGFDPTVGSEGQIIGVSTAKGRRGLFYHMYQGAKRRENGFINLFLPAGLRPDYTVEFLAGKRAMYEAAGEPWRYAVEFCENEAEAFGSSLDTFFTSDSLERLWGAVRPAEWVPQEVPWRGLLRVWGKPRYGQRYTIGADVADRGPDRSVAVVLEAVTGRHVASLRSGSIAPYDFAGLLDQLGRMYGAVPGVETGHAMIAVERNGHGIAVLEALQKVHNYSNLYFGRDRNKKMVLGWQTTALSRPLMLNDLKVAVSDGSFYTEDDETVEEFSTFEEGQFRPAAAAEAHDDYVFAHAICWQARAAYPVLRGVRRTPMLAR